MSQLNPFDTLNLTRPQPQSPQLPPLAPDEQASLLEKIGHAGLGGLSFIAGILNKPGRVVRGLLGGTPREALNVIPFSDTLGLTDPAQEVRGSHLLHSAGLANEKDPSLLSPEGAAGFGMDVATDPLTYLTFGASALTKAGNAAKLSGHLPGTVGERVAQGLGGHVGLHVPFTGASTAFNLSPLASALNRGVRAVPGGNAFADLAGNAGSAVAGLYNKTIPPLFEKSVLGQTDPIAQQVAREVSGGISEAQAAARTRVAGLTDSLPTIDQAGARELRQGLETLGAPANPALAPAITGQRQYTNELLSDLNSVGRPDKPLMEPGMGYAPRQATISMKGDVAGALGSGLKPRGQIPAREELFKGLPTEGKASINDLTRRDDLLPIREAYNAGQKQPLIDVVSQQYVKLDQAELTALRDQASMAKKGIGLTIPPDMDRLALLEAKAKQAENLADWVATSVPPELAKGGLGFFDRHPHLDLVEKAQRDAVDILKAKGLHKALAKMTAQDAAGVPLADVLEKAGLTYKANGESTAMMRTLESMQAEGKLPAGATLKDMAGWTIPADQVDRVAKFTKTATSPEGLKPFLNLFDSVTNLTKAFQTTIWPANWARNQGQALFQNWIHDAFNAQAAGPMKWVKPMLDAKAWREGGVIKGANAYPGFEHMTEEAASALLSKEIKTLNVHSAFRHPEADIVGADITTRQLLPDVAGAARKPFKDILKGYIPTSKAEANPLNVAGFGNRLEDTFAPVRAGREFNQEMHAVDRVSTYLAKRSQGFAPDAAVREVNLAHYDFGNLTSFEKQVMKRIIPFYTFARQNVPAVISELGRNPGGKLAQTVRAVNELKGTHPGFLPPQVSDGVAAPIGAEENGTQRYLTHLGLGFEDLGRMAGPGGPLGMLNPLIKAPIEQATGKQLFTGRDLGDLYSPLSQLTGQPLGAAENLIANSPLGRVYTTGRTLMDERKSLPDKLVNTLTGARLSDVNVDQARHNAIRDYITSNLRGPAVSHFDQLSVRPENMPLLSPLEQQLYRLQRTLQSRQGRQL